MRHLRLAAVVAATLFVGMEAAQATSHVRDPIADAGLIGAVLYEFEHFVMHLKFTLHALMLCFVSPELGVAMLADQTLCATVTPLTGFLFGGALMSVVTFLVTIALVAFVAMLLVSVLYRALHRAATAHSVSGAP